VIIAISANGRTLDAEVDSRFGSCQYFIIADTEADEFEAADNSTSSPEQEIKTLRV
jgi:predicted Fe-Mo cluster-binding NifX family protein